MQVSCILECRMKKTIDNMTEVDRCMPWYLPPVDGDVRLCSPFEARIFKKKMELIGERECKVKVFLLFHEIVLKKVC